MHFVPVVACLVALSVPGPARASADEARSFDGTPAVLFQSTPHHLAPYRSLFEADAVVPRSTTSIRVLDDPAQTPAPPVAAVEYSSAYRTRLKIHKLASFAILPLFGTELILGQSLYTNGGSGKKSAHVVVGVGIGSLFGINTVTGLWNLWDSRKDPAGRTRRILHSVLMLASDAGFTATAALAPGHQNAGLDARRTHRAVAVTSIAAGTAGYLIMLLTK
jgi:hypothetical protein